MSPPVPVTDEQLVRRFTEARLELIEFAARHPLDALLTRALDVVGAFVDSPIGFYHFVEDDQVTLSLQQWSTRTLREFCRAEGKGLHSLLDAAGVWADCVRERRPVVHNDYASLPHRRGLPEGHAAVVRELVVPVMRDDRVRAILGVGNKPTDYTPRDVDVVAYLADVTWEIVSRKRLDVALRESESRFRALFEQSNDACFLATTDGRLVDVNGALLDLFGYRRDEMGALDLDDWWPEEPAARSQALGGRGARLETRFLARSGGLFPAELATTVIASQGSRLVQGVIHDLTEQHRSARERDALQAQLFQAQKMESIGQLAGGVAHDFNNHLTVILSLAELAIGDLREADPLRVDLEQILESAQRAASLTRQLLAFSRRQVMKPEVLDLNRVLAELDKMLRRLIGEDVELATVLDPDLASVLVDPAQMEQVVLNLAVNARDALPRGGRLTLETANVYLDEAYASSHADARAGDHVLLAVSDNGEGMTPEVRARIFEPFYTTKAAGRGTGLGLSTVYGIVKQCGGNIWVYSEPGEGTTFKVYLPVAGTTERQSVAHRARPAVVMGHESVLVVEDDPAVRRLAQRVLEAAGYRVITAANGGEALLLVEDGAEPIDLLLTDVVMPRMSGRALAERLEQLCPGLQVVYMSGYTTNSIVHHGVLDEGLVFVPKPFAQADLLAAVRAVLDERRR